MLTSRPNNCYDLMNVCSLPPISLYIHVPWCVKKCPYCDFNSHAIRGALPEAVYIDALLADLVFDWQQFRINRPIQSLFIGGGTPSLFSPTAIDRLLRGIEKHALISKELEITLEANPGTFDSEKFSEFRSIGINRLSIGIQSFNDPVLKTLGRIHNSQEAIQSVDIAHKAGFANINLDLMFGFPHDHPEVSLHDMTTAISLDPTHISFYQFTLEPNTWFFQFPPQLPDDDSIFLAQLQCQQLLAEANYQQYEVSAYSKPGRQCQHNLNYWQFGDYLGIGAGAHGKISLSLPNQIIRRRKPKRPEHYLKQPTGIDTLVNPMELPLEFLMNHLRLRSGFTLTDYQTATGLDPESLEPALSECVAEQLLIHRQNQYYCSPRGWNFLNTLLEKFIN